MFSTSDPVFYGKRFGTILTHPALILLHSVSLQMLHYFTDMIEDAFLLDVAADGLIIEQDGPFG
jgi:hypothetical protein